MMADDPNFDIKYQLTNEHLRTGGTEKIFDVNLLEDIMSLNPDDLSTLTPRLRAFMSVIFASHRQTPLISEEGIAEYRSLLQKSYSFDQYTINTEAEFDAIYEQYKDSNDILFRGQREASWCLYNSLQRNWILKELHNKGFSYETLLERFVATGKADFKDKILEILGAYHIDILNNVAILGFLQHHGCPTPLLDWTYKIQNAIYFGLDGLELNQGPREIDDYFSIYFIKESDMEGGGLREVMQLSLNEVGDELLAAAIAAAAPDEGTRSEMEEHFRGRRLFDDNRIPGSGLIDYITQVKRLLEFPLSFFSDKDAQTGFIFSLNNSHNILNQAGVFVWNASPFKPLEVMGMENFKEAFKDDNPNDYRFCECFNINKCLEPYIRKRLEDDGITKDYIYPAKDTNTWYIFEKCMAD